MLVSRRFVAIEDVAYAWKDLTMGNGNDTGIAGVLTLVKERRKFWLVPLIIVLLLCGGFIILTQGASVTPFIYTLF